MNTNKNINLALGLLILLTSCTTYDDLVTENTPTPESEVPIIPGMANFSKFVALGNSQTAGFMDAALYSAGQDNSFPAILSEQFALAGGGAFNQPDINSANGFNPLFSTPTKIVGRLRLNTSGDSPTVEAAEPGDPLGPFTGDMSALNNFGVPVARVVDALVPGYGAFNPYFPVKSIDEGWGLLWI